MVHNVTGHYCLKAKPDNVNEGGVATGYAASDSLILSWLNIYYKAYFIFSQFFRCIQIIHKNSLFSLLLKTYLT